MNVKKIQKEVINLRNIEGDLEGAIDLLESNIDTVDRKDKSALFMALAVLYSDVGRNKESIETSELALKLAKKTGNDWVEANVSRRLGWVIWSTRESKDKAMRLVKDSLRITEKHSDKPKFQRVAASAWAAVGNIEFDAENYKGALSAYKKGLRLAKKTAYVEREATLLGDIGYVYLSINDFSRAEKALKQAERLGRKQYRHELPTALLRLGYVYFHESNSKKSLNTAKKYFKESLMVALQDGWRREQADARFALAKIAVEKRDKDEAVNLCREAIKIYQEIGMFKKKEEVNTFLKSN